MSDYCDRCLLRLLFGPNRRPVPFALRAAAGREARMRGLLAEYTQSLGT